MAVGGNQEVHGGCTQSGGPWGLGASGRLHGGWTQSRGSWRLDTIERFLGVRHIREVLVTASVGVEFS
jgi:hypothetical protein